MSANMTVKYSLKSFLIVSVFPKVRLTTEIANVTKNDFTRIDADTRVVVGVVLWDVDHGQVEPALEPAYNTPASRWNMGIIPTQSCGCSVFCHNISRQ